MFSRLENCIDGNFYGKNERMEWVFLSPHPDDVALSCGGAVWERSRHGDAVSIWTICAGDPAGGAISPFARALQQRWETGHASAAQRRLEDQASCAVLDAAFLHLPIPDCIYRKAPDSEEYLYACEEALWRPVHPADAGLEAWLSEELLRHLPCRAELVCPLALGGHVDHRLTRQAAERLGRSLWYYADYPYVLSNDAQLAALAEAGWTARLEPVSDPGLSAWVGSVAAHLSQISTFWPDVQVMRQALTDYRDRAGGVYLWQAPVFPG
jgi:LmbE family N-acetylglucosaminyl deacetylase